MHTSLAVDSAAFSMVPSLAAIAPTPAIMPRCPTYSSNLHQGTVNNLEPAAGRCSLTPSTSSYSELGLLLLLLLQGYAANFAATKSNAHLAETSDHAVPIFHMPRSAYVCFQEAKGLTFCLIQGCWPACLIPLPASQSP